MTSDVKNGYCQQVADERKAGTQESIRGLCACGPGTSIHNKECPYVAEWHRQDAAKREAEAFRDYQRIMAEQAKASVAAREARQRLAGETGLASGSLGYTQAVHVERPSRTFTREEVLTVLRTCVALNTTMAEAVRVFERVE